MLEAVSTRGWAVTLCEHIKARCNLTLRPPELGRIGHGLQISDW